MLKLFCFLIIVTIVGTVTARGDDFDLYVKSKYAEVRPDLGVKNSDDPTIMRGTGMNKIQGPRKKYYEVKYKTETGDEKTGWVFKGKVTKEAPEPDTSLATAKGQNPLAGEETAASRAARGIGPVAANWATKYSIQEIHKKYLYYHQSFVTTNKAIAPSDKPNPYSPKQIANEKMQKFLQEGKLGEFKESSN